MRKRNLIIGAVLVLAVLVGLFVFIKNQENVVSVASDDGLATLTIPGDALPKGISPNDVSIKKYEGELQEGEYARYVLLPDGLTFESSVTFSATMNIPDGNLPVVLSYSGDTAELLEAKEIASGDDGTTVVVELSHFSEVAFSEGPYVVSPTPGPIEREVGNSFNLGLTISIKNPYEVYAYARRATEGDLLEADEPTYEGQLPYRRFEFFGTAIVEGQWFEVRDEHNPGILKPQGNDVFGTFGEFYFDDVEFKCEKVGGPVEVILGADIRTPAELYRWSGGSSGDWGTPQNIEYKQRYVDSVEVTCVPKAGDEALIGEEPEGEDSTPAPQGGEGGEIEAEVIFLNGQPYYSAHFYSLEPEGSCPVEAWYTANYDRVWGWESSASSKIVTTFYADEENIGCGFGSVAENPAQIINITKEMADAMNNASDKGFIDGCHHTCQ